jgi:NO-binding membrane sensor protein with MHYT domain
LMMVASTSMPPAERAKWSHRVFIRASISGNGIWAMEIFSMLAGT